MPAISPARKAAFEILMAVERGQAHSHSHSDDLLRGKAVNALSAPDRNLTTALVLGVLRWQIQLDHLVQPLLKRPNAKLDPEILVALRMGAFQLLHLDRIPARAAIDESVELAKQSGHKFASGMVNAVLRKLAATTQYSATAKSHEDAQSLATARSHEKAGALKGHGFSRAGGAEKDEGALAPGGGHTSAAAELALSEAHPAWLVERWVEHYGLDAARAICRHGQTQPALTIRITAPDVEQELMQAGIQLGPGELLTAARTVLSGDVTTTRSFREGRIRLQDEGSQLVAEIAALGSAGGAQTILDCCAAPGGKTLILAERNPQARIVACESSPPRLTQLRVRLAGNSDRIECRLADATVLTELGVFDLALADVPCSGTGTLGRNPEIRHRLQLDDLPRQAERQRDLLNAALRPVRVGGCVVYSTCSLEPEENEQVVEAVLAQNSHAQIVPLKDRIEKLAQTGIMISAAAERLQSCLVPDGTLRLMPRAFHTDGFFIALIEKTS